MMPPVAPGAAAKSDAVGAYQSAHGIEFVFLELPPDNSRLRLIQRHDHTGQPFQDRAELGKLSPPGGRSQHLRRGLFSCHPAMDGTSEVVERYVKQIEKDVEPLSAPRGRLRRRS
jgi:hypothetical protein